MARVHYFTRGGRNNSIPYMVPLFVLFDYLRYLLKIIFGGFDLIHVNVSLGKRNLIRDPFFVVAAKLLGKRVLLFIHGWDKNYENDSRGLRMFRRADSIIVLAREFKDKLEAMGYRGKINVESTVVDQRFSDKFTIEEIDLKQKKKTANILFLSRLEKEKGVYQILKAFEIINGELGHTKLLIAGTGPELEAVKKYVSARNLVHVDICGYVTGEKKIEIFKLADIYAFPTFYGEGMPISILEAMTAGLPVITRPVGGIRDFFEHDKMGFLTDSTNPEVIAGLMRHMVLNKEKCNAMARYNYEYARQHFIAPIIVERLEQIYAEVI